MTQNDWIAAVADVARDWQDPDYEQRANAVEVTLEAPSRYTEPGLAYALNHRMQQFSSDALPMWIGRRVARRPLNVGIVCADAPPLHGLVEAVAALVLGHRVWIAPSESSPALITAFFDDLMDRTNEDPVRFVSRPVLFEQVDLLVSSGDADNHDDLDTAAGNAGIPPEQRWLHRHGLVAAVIDGREDAETRSGLAEDLLLHEGLGPRTPSLLWAPSGFEPDPLLDTLAGFRELYPAHPKTDGTLAMPTAFLASAKQAHATGPGFLVSKGEAEPQAPGHIRWVEYESLAEVSDWLVDRAETLAFVVATKHVAEQIDADVVFVSPGDAHRPALGEEVPGLVSFLADG